AGVLDLRDLVEPRLDRREALCLDRRLVHERLVVVADALAVAARLARRALEDLARARLAAIGERGEHAVVGLVGGDLGGLEPGPVGVAIEALAGRDRLVHARGV